MVFGQFLLVFGMCSEGWLVEAWTQGGKAGAQNGAYSQGDSYPLALPSAESEPGAATACLVGLVSPGTASMLSVFGVSATVPHPSGGLRQSPR